MKNTPFDKLCGRSLPREYQMQLLRRMIQTELTELQRQTLVAYYFDNKNLPRIAAERGVHKSTVWRTLKRAEDKIRRVLMY
ncbi:MAG: sigma-70 family RNA polymerase sigma factor [Oscillospiraceae bacterium]|nr:sigma-70 family RNA polymerase sigma factor [Oscillospiraceae bacterium]